MEIDLVKSKDGGSSLDSMENQVGEFRAISMPMIFIGTFEDEVDAFIELAESEPNPSITESLFKRYAVIEEILTTLTKEMTRVSLKVEIAGTKMVDRLI